jgi:ribonuclease E
VEELTIEAGATVEGGKKRKRRKKKKKSAGDLHFDAAGTDQADTEQGQSDATLTDETSEYGEVSSPEIEESTGEAVLKTKKRKRKKKKSAGGVHPDTTDTDQTDNEPEQSEASLAEEVFETEEVSSPDNDESDGDSALKPKKRKRRRSRSKAHKTPEGSADDAAAGLPPEREALEVAVPDVAPPEEPPTPAKTKRTRTARKKITEVVAEESPVPSEPAMLVATAVNSELIPVQKKPRRAAPKKEVALVDVHAPEPETVPAKAAARPRRKKKDDEIK